MLDAFVLPHLNQAHQNVDTYTASNPGMTMVEMVTKLSEVKEGMVTARDVVSGGGMMLIPKGTVIGTRQLRLLSNWSVENLFVKSQTEVEQEEWTLETNSEFHKLAEQKVEAKFATITKRNAWTEAVEKIATDYIALRLRNVIRQPSRPVPNEGRVEATPPLGRTTAKRFLELVDADKLPTLPAVYRSLSAAVDNPETTTETIASIINQDLSLAARLLRLANSAFCGHASRVDSIEEAVKIIGFCAVRDLTLATYVIGAFKNLPASLVEMTDFWRHSISVGVMSRQIAQERQSAQRDSYFTAGLLHDLGRLAMYQFAPRESETILNLGVAKVIAPCDAELSVLGFDHGELGAEMLRAWNLPERLIELVGGHHNPCELTRVKGDMTLHVADFVMTAVEYGSSGEGRMTPLVCDPAIELGIEPDRLRDLVKETLRNCDELCSILSD